MTDAVVYLACEPLAADQPDVRLVLSAPEADRLLLAAWTTLDRLVAACGEEQSWVAVPLEDAAGLRVQAGAAALVLDPPSMAVWS